jgi:hypothetical protein
MWMRGGMLMVAALMLCGPMAVGGQIVWAWERPEDLRFVDGRAEVAVQKGFIVLSGAGLYVRGRRFPLIISERPSTVLIHIQIDHHRPLAWTSDQRRQTAQAVLALAQSTKARRVQLDFEVRQSERPILLDLLTEVRRELPRDEDLSMTALASWCETETWLDAAPVDESFPCCFEWVQAASR